jgi:hypothetical protein
MSDRELKTLGVILGAVVLLYLATLVLGRGDGGSEVDPESPMAALLESLSAEGLRAVELSGPTLDEPVRLERSGATWTANGHVADSANVARLLDALDGAELGDLASVNPSNHRRMGVAADSTAVMVLVADGGADTLFLGAPASGFGTVFARVPDDDRVYLIRGELRAPATRPLDQWRSRRVLTLDTAAVASLVLTRESDRMELVRTDSTWSLDGVAAERSAVGQILGELVALQAQGFSELEAPPEGPPSRTVLAADASGAVLAHVRVWDPEAGGDGSVLVLADGEVTEPGTVYTLATWRRDRLVPTREQLTPAPTSEGG